MSRRYIIELIECGVTSWTVRTNDPEDALNTLRDALLRAGHTPARAGHFLDEVTAHAVGGQAEYYILQPDDASAALRFTTK